MSNTVVNATAVNDEMTWSTTAAPFTPEEEDAIVTLVVVIVGILAAIVILFSMGIFIDYKHQKKDLHNKRRVLKLRMPQIPRREHRYQEDDAKSFASDMCPSGITESGSVPRDAIV